MRPYSSVHAARIVGAICVVAILSACGMAERQLPLAPSTGETDQQTYDSANQRLFRMAQSAARAGDRRTAIGIFQQLASNEPTAFSAWYELGDLLLAEGEARGSADAFAHILTSEPQDTRATLGYARAMMTLGRPEAASAHMEPLLEREPENLRFLNLLAVIRDLQGDHGGAMELYRQGLSYDPESVTLRNNMALSAALAGNTETAVELIRPVAEGLQSTRRTRQNLALIYGLAGEYAAAERVSLIDLDNNAVSNNLMYFAALRAMEPSQARTTVLKPDGRISAPISRELNVNVDVGVADSSQVLDIATVPAERWFLSLGKFASADQAAEKWRQIRGDRSEIVAGLRPLATGSNGSSELIVGTVSSEPVAQQACRQLISSAPNCEPIKL